MKVRNNDLSYVTNMLLDVRKEKVSTKIAMAVTKSINALGKATSEYNDTRVSIIEPFAKLDKDGVAIQENEDFIDDFGKKQTALMYQFETPELKAECIAKINELNNLEVNVPVQEITEEDILAEPKLTPDQVNALLMLVKQI